MTSTNRYYVFLPGMPFAYFLDSPLEFVLGISLAYSEELDFILRFNLKICF